MQCPCTLCGTPLSDGVAAHTCPADPAELLKANHRLENRVRALENKVIHLETALRSAAGRILQ